MRRIKNKKIHYEEAKDIKRKVESIALVLGMKHLKMNRIFCIRSHGSKSKNVIARCHSLPKIMQLCLSSEPAYIIEVISENFDSLDEDEKTKTLIHEMLHIPKSFAGGFRYHDFITKRRVERLFVKYKKIKITTGENKSENKDRESYLFKQY